MLQALEIVADALREYLHFGPGPGPSANGGGDGGGGGEEEEEGEGRGRTGERLVAGMEFSPWHLRHSVRPVPM
jgi:hypothetical protein